jgi:hypothetical protein
VVQALITQDLDTFRSLVMSLCPPYAPFFGFAGVASSVSFYSPSRHSNPNPISPTRPNRWVFLLIYAISF